MIELSLGEFAAGVAGVAMVWVLASAVLSRISEARALRRALEFRVTCRLCGHVFEDRSGDPFPRCPECGAKNIRK
jgi:rRNA maturation endonuclease Nob1